MNYDVISYFHMLNELISIAKIVFFKKYTIFPI